MSNFNDSSGNRANVLVVVPVYNAAARLPELIARFKPYVCPEHLLFVDDGSIDGSCRVIEEHRLICLRHPQNRGKGAALRAGFRYAMERGYRSVLTIDADLQHRPEEIPGFYGLDNGCRVVLGTREIRLGKMPVSRWFSNSLTSLVISVFSNQRIRDSQSGYRLIPTRLLRIVPLKATGFDLESEVLFKAGAVGCEVIEQPVSTIYEGGPSHISHLADTARFLRQFWRRIWI